MRATSKIFRGVILLTLVVNVACGNRQNGQTNVDSTLYLNDNIKYGDSISTLVRNGIAAPYAEKPEDYSIVDKSYMGVSFDEATAHIKDNKVSGISYYSNSNDKPDSIRTAFAKLQKALVAKYGKWTSDTAYIESAGNPRFQWHWHNYIWQKEKTTIKVRSRVVKWLLGDGAYSIFVDVDYGK